MRPLVVLGALLLLVHTVVLHFSASGSAPWLSYIVMSTLLLPVSALVLLFLLWLAAPALYFKRTHGRWPWSRPAKPCGQAAHAEGTSLVVDQVLAWKAQPRRARQPLCTAKERRQSVTTRDAAYKRECHKITLSHLNRVVALDEAAMLVTVEPNVDMRQLQHFLAARGLALTVTGETDKMSMGGTLMGTGIESSSHRFGLFYESCVAFELLLADGSIVRPTRTEHVELFHALPFSYGTGGLLLSATLICVRAQPFVKVSYRIARSHAQVCALLTNRSTASSSSSASASLDGSGSGFADDFVDGLCFSSSLSTVISGSWSDGRGADSALPVAQPVSRWWQPFYSDHVRAICEAAVSAGGGGSDFDAGGEIVYEELQPAVDYLFRYDRGCFWTLTQAMPRLGRPWARLLFGWAFNSRLFHLLPDKGTSELRNDQVVQDATVAMEHGAEALDRLTTLFAIYPIWLCACLNVSHTAGNGGGGGGGGGSEKGRRRSRSPPRSRGRPAVPPHAGGARPTALVKLKPHSLLLDIGIYGKPKALGFDTTHAHREMEDLMHRLGGFIFSYGISFTTRKEFWERWYDPLAYARFREITGSEGAFPDVFDKIGGGKKVKHLE